VGFPFPSKLALRILTLCYWVPPEEKNRSVPVSFFRFRLTLTPRKSPPARFTFAAHPGHLDFSDRGRIISPPSRSVKRFFPFSSAEVRNISSRGDLHSSDISVMTSLFLLNSVRQPSPCRRSWSFPLFCLWCSAY